MRDLSRRALKRKEALEIYDAFMCYSRTDEQAQPFIAAILEALAKHGLHVWFDKENLMPGVRWTKSIWMSIASVRCAALVVIGPWGLGPFQEREVAKFLEENRKRGLKVIPVLVAGVAWKSVPSELRNFQAVECGKIPTFDSEELTRLVAGIVGCKKGKDFRRSLEDHLRPYAYPQSS
jgi:hypothetical protein